jgi:hypothetical protein
MRPSPPPFTADLRNTMTLRALMSAHVNENGDDPDRTYWQRAQTDGFIEAVKDGDGADPRRDALYREAVRDTIERFEETGSAVVTDGEQRKYHNFWTYAAHGLRTPRPTASSFLFRPATRPACRASSPARSV